jgi:molecular chaperone Hsp33
MNKGINKVITAIDQSGSFRVYLTITTKMVEEARKIHNTTPLATAALGRALTGAGLMGLLLKRDEDKLTILFKGDGPAEQIIATANGAGKVKGFIANPFVDLPKKENGKLDVGGAIGKGTLTIISDYGMKQPYVGKIDLVSGEIAEDLTAYYFISEQRNTSVALGVKIERDFTVAASGGMIIQMMPEPDNKAVEALEEMIENMPALTELIEEEVKKSEGKTVEAIMQGLLDSIFKGLPQEFKVNPLEFRDIGWECDCSEERLEQVVISIGEKDLKEIIEEDGQAELVCQFCSSKYFFDKEHLTELLEATKS